VVWNAGDDAIDTDQSWSGTLDNFVVIAPGNHNFELDGPEGSMKAGHTIQNGTVVANDPSASRVSSDLINLDDNSMVSLKNIWFTQVGAGQKINRVTFNTGEVSFSGISLNVAADQLATHVNGTVPGGVQAAANPTAKANVSVLNWTWASKAGKFAGL
jgi:outer membrane murein-binding lipoprotein Lpp